jgi:putative SOS response-associated peptidase YedK
MGKTHNRMLVYLNDELTEWLNEKASKGYKKATLVRKVLDDYRKAEVMQNGNHS